MITDVFISFIYDVFMFLVNGREPLRFNVDSSFYTAANDFLAFMFYILPIDGLMIIIEIIIIIIGFRIFISVIKTLWDLLPLL